MSGPQQHLKCTRRKCDIVPRPPATLQCEKCRRIWCCLECCIEDDNLDHEHYDMISDHQYDLRPRPPYESLVDPNVTYQEHPPIWSIVCCDCSGKPLSYHDRPDD